MIGSNITRENFEDEPFVYWYEIEWQAQEVDRTKTKVFENVYVYYVELDSEFLKELNTDPNFILQLDDIWITTPEMSWS